MVVGRCEEEDFRGNQEALPDHPLLLSQSVQVPSEKLLPARQNLAARVEWTRSVGCELGVRDKVLQSLASQVAAKKMDPNCCLMVDEMATRRAKVYSQPKDKSIGHATSLVDEHGKTIRGPHFMAVMVDSERHEKRAAHPEYLSYRCSRDGLLSERILLCADTMFLLTALGMKAATSATACIYCTRKKQDYFRSNGELRSHIPGDLGRKLRNLLLFVAA